MDITGLTELSTDDIIIKLEGTISKDKKSKKKIVRERADENERILNKVKRETSTDPHVKLRPLVKHWIIKFLFGKLIVNPNNKEVKGIERNFLKTMCNTLKRTSLISTKNLSGIKNTLNPKGEILLKLQVNWHGNYRRKK